MKTRNFLLALSLTLTMCLAIRAIADNDIDLRINGDFRGSPVGYSPAPGWTLTPDGGNARIHPTSDRKDFCLELIAAPNRSQSVVTNLHPLPGRTLKLEVHLRGVGTAAIGYEAFDQTGKTLVAADRQLVQLSNYEQEVKRHFPINASAAYIRIRLTAEAGSRAMFRDVDAEVSNLVAGVPSAAPGTIAAPPAAPGTVVAPPAAPGAVVAPPTHGHSGHHQYKPLADDQFFALESLGNNEHFAVSVPVGKDIDLDLGEDPNRNLLWRVASYDARICRVELEHDRDGKRMRRRFKAEIEMKALRPGKTSVVFTCGAKRLTIHFTAF